MGITVRKKSVKFCPFCGSNGISHIENGIFFCGPLDPTEESVKESYLFGNNCCGRVFRVVRGFVVDHKELKRRFNNIQQMLFQKNEIIPPKRGGKLVR